MKNINILDPFNKNTLRNMRPKDDLFHLIKSLSSSEKRYFTLDAKKSGAKSTNYLTLFQAINAMDVYDEKDLKKSFNNISMDKAYLYESILKSMRDYRATKSKGAQLKQTILDVRFLFERGLYDQCADRIKQAKSIANDLSDSLALLEINREERRLFKQIGVSFFRENLEDFKNENQLQLQFIKEEFLFLDIYDDLALAVSSNFRFSKESDRLSLKEQIKPLLEKEPQGTQAKFRFLQSNALYQILMGNPQEAGKYFSLSADLWDENPSIKREEFNRYIKDLANAVATSFAARQMETVAQLLAKLEQQKPENFNEENLIFGNLASHKLNFLLETRQFDKANSVAKDIEQDLKKFEISDSIRLTIKIQTALLLMAANSLDESKKWLKKIMNFKDLNIRKDIQKAARILNLLLAASTDDLEPVELLLRSYLRFYKKSFKPEEIEFEMQFLPFFKTIIPLPLDRQNRKAINEFMERMQDAFQRSASLQVLKSWMDFMQISDKKPI